MNLSRSMRGNKEVADDIGLSHLIGSDAFEDESQELLEETPANQLFLPGGSGDDVIDYEKTVAQAPTDFDRPQRDLDDTAMVMYTSGTTGKPKGVHRTHRNELTNYESLSASGSFTTLAPDASILMSGLPMFHISGLNVMTVLMLYNGATVILHEEFEPRQVLKDVERYEIEHLGLVPPMLIELNKVYEENPDEYDLSAPEVAHVGAGALPESVRRSFVENWKITLNEGLAMTETGGTGTYKPHAAPKKEAGCIGPPMYNISVKLVDEQTRETVVPADYLAPHVEMSDTDLDFEDEDSVTGEVAFKGPQVFKKYHNRPEKNAEVFDDEGWYYTGDVARVDDDGFLWYVDRGDDMIVVGGENVYPTEVEEALFAHPAVHEAAVVPADHEIKGEAPVAFVDIDSDQDVTEIELRKFTLDRVPTYAHPRRVFFIEDFPKSATQKTQRFKLAQRASELLDGPLESSDKI
jgi:long-chain acyl-CoA synthetase